MNIKMYMCVVNNEDNDAEIFTSNNFMELMHKVIENILENYLDDFPALNKFKVDNSVDFISDYDEEDYRDILNKMLFLLQKNRVEYKAKFLELDQEINNGNLMSISHDMI